MNTYRKPLPARRSQPYFDGGGYDADRQDSGQVAGVIFTTFHLTNLRSSLAPLTLSKLRVYERVILFRVGCNLQIFLLFALAELFD